MTGHNADPDAVRVRSLAMALGDEILARYVAELDQAAERLADAIRGAQSARERLVAASALAEQFTRFAARLEDDAIDADTLEAAGTTIETVEETMGIGPAPILEAS